MTCKHYPHQVSHSCPFLGKARIPERSDEASDPDFPVLAPGGCGRVLCAVPTASAIHLSLPGCSHSSCAAEAWPWAHPGHSRLHPLCSLLNTCSPQQARPTERRRGKAQRIQRCKALYVTVTTPPPPTYKVQAADQPNLQSQMEARLTGTIPPISCAPSVLPQSIGVSEIFMFLENILIRKREPTSVFPWTWSGLETKWNLFLADLTSQLFLGCL